MIAIEKHGEMSHDQRLKSLLIEQNGELGDPMETFAIANGSSSLTPCGFLQQDRLWHTWSSEEACKNTIQIFECVAILLLKGLGHGIRLPGKWVTKSNADHLKQASHRNRDAVCTEVKYQQSRRQQEFTCIFNIFD